MLLRLIDQSHQTKKSDFIKVVFESEEFTKCYEAEFYPSPLSENFRKDLAWYFGEYLLEEAQKELTAEASKDNSKKIERDDKGIIQRLISLGQNEGDKLLGEDHQLYSIKEIIEDQGYDKLKVRMESSRSEFFSELWEVLILPDAKYVLSCVAEEFVRYPFNLDDQEKMDQKPLPSVDEFREILYELSGEEPLNIFCLCAMNKKSSHAYQYVVGSLAVEGALRFELSRAVDSEDLFAQIDHCANVPHVFHYEGPIIFEGQIPFIYLPDHHGAGQWLSLETLSAFLSKRKILTFFMIPTAYYFSSGGELNDKSKYLGDIEVTAIARIVLAAGVPNMVSLRNPTDSWTGQESMQVVYEHLCKGLSLAQSVVEARKKLQTNVVSTHGVAQGLPFQSWPLLLHYSTQSVKFFDSPQPRIDIHESRRYWAIRARLHGLRSELLPPEVAVAGDGQLIELIGALNGYHNLQQGKIVYLKGEEGSGKTHLFHQIAFYMTFRDDVDFAFYYNFRNTMYSSNEILRMIGPIIDVNFKLKKECEQEILLKASKKKCLFLFDNYFKAEVGEENKKLEQLFNILCHQGHKVLVSDCMDVKDSQPWHQISIAPLLMDAQRALASIVLKNNNLSEKSEINGFNTLLNACEGSPFLIKSVLPSLATDSIDSLIRNVEGFKNQGKVEAFYQWKWDELEPLWQRLLLVFSENSDVILEMIGIVSLQEQNNSPLQDLLVLLGAEKEQYGDGFNKIRKSGFLLQYPHGHIVNSRSLVFLKKKMMGDKIFVDKEDEINLLKSTILAQGLCLIVPNLQHKPNPTITNNLIHNCWRWKACIECLWRAREYALVIRLKTNLEGLLRSYKLEKEINVWMKDLFESFDLDVPIDQCSMIENLSKLTVATDALKVEVVQGEDEQIEATDESSIRFRYFANIWFNWLQALTDEMVKSNAALFHRAIKYVEAFFQKNQDWQSYYNVCELAYEAYRKNEAWPLVHNALLSLCKCCFMVGEKDKGEYFEKELLEGIPYEDLPAHMKTQSILEVIGMRLERDNTTAAQHLLDELSDVNSANEMDRKMRPLLQDLQAEIYLKQNRIGEAAQIYCLLWRQLVDQEHQYNKEHIKSQLAKVEEKMGKSEFLSVFKSIAGENTPFPQEN